MTNFEIITIIANQLANAGKKPTVALIKGKLPAPVPLPQIISTLKNWQHEPENCSLAALQALKDTTSNSDKDTDVNLNKDKGLSIEQVNVLIEQALAPIKKELAAVKLQLQQLK